MARIAGLWVAALYGEADATKGLFDEEAYRMFVIMMPENECEPMNSPAAIPYDE